MIHFDHVNVVFILVIIVNIIYVFLERAATFLVFQSSLSSSSTLFSSPMSLEFWGRRKKVWYYLYFTVVRVLPSKQLNFPMFFPLFYYMLSFRLRRRGGWLVCHIFTSHAPIVALVSCYLTFPSQCSQTVFWSRRCMKQK